MALTGPDRRSRRFWHPLEALRGIFSGIVVSDVIPLEVAGVSAFSRLSNKLGRRKGVRNPDALAAAIGRRKYGAKGMAKKAAAGRRKAGR